MKAIFLSGSEGSLKNVYNPALREKMARELEFADPMTRFSEEDFARRAEELAQVDFIFSTWGMPHLSRETIREKLPNVKAVFYGAGSVQGFAREFLAENRTVVSAWAANAVPVAEFTVSEILLASKGFFQRSQIGSAQEWENRGFGGSFSGNYHTKVGIIGAGMVGKAVIGLLKNYVLDVLVFDPFLPDDAAQRLGVQKTDLETIFRECDVISNHLANNPQTVGMLHYALFSLMKKNACFINTGRGAQVVEADLVRAMREEPARFALLDVTNPEPPLPGSELYRTPNILLSPHIAGSLGREVERMGEYMFEEYRRFVSGEPLRYAVTMQMLATMA